MKLAIAQLADGVSALVAHRRPRMSVTPAGTSVLPDDPPRGWSDVTDELLRLRRLESDWDGQGAEAPTAEAVDTALTIAGELRSAGMPPADRALAGVNGTVFFEWHDPKQYLEVEVFTRDRTEGRWVYPDTNTVEEFTLTR